MNALHSLIPDTAPAPFTTELATWMQAPPHHSPDKLRQDISLAQVTAEQRTHTHMSPYDVRRLRPNLV